jgi:hypothetical protein
MENGDQRFGALHVDFFQRCENTRNPDEDQYLSLLNTLAPKRSVRRSFLGAIFLFVSHLLIWIFLFLLFVLQSAIIEKQACHHGVGRTRLH